MSYGLEYPIKYRHNILSLKGVVLFNLKVQVLVLKNLVFFFHMYYRNILYKRTKVIKGQKSVHVLPKHAIGQNMYGLLTCI